MPTQSRYLMKKNPNAAIHISKLVKERLLKEGRSKHEGTRNRELGQLTDDNLDDLIGIFP